MNAKDEGKGGGVGQEMRGEEEERGRRKSSGGRRKPDVPPCHDSVRRARHFVGRVTLQNRTFLEQRLSPRLTPRGGGRG